MRKTDKIIYLTACSIFTTASASFALLFKCDTFSLSMTMASPLVSLFSAGINSALTPFTVLMMVFTCILLMLAGAAAASSGGVVDVVFVASLIVVVTTLSVSKLSFVVSKFNFVVSKFNFVGGGADAIGAVVFGVGVDASDESMTTLSCLSLLSSLRLVDDATLSCFSLPPSLRLSIRKSDAY